MSFTSLLGVLMRVFERVKYPNFIKENFSSFFQQYVLPKISSTHPWFYLTLLFRNGLNLRYSDYYRKLCTNVPLILDTWYFCCPCSIVSFSPSLATVAEWNKKRAWGDFPSGKVATLFWKTEIFTAIDEIGINGTGIGEKRNFFRGRNWRLPNQTTAHLYYNRPW